MISVRRAQARQLEQVLVPQRWHTFDAREPSLHPAGFYALEHLDENRLPPDDELLHRSFARAEWLTYVVDGALAFDADGLRGVLRAGDFQRVSSSLDHRQHESNPSHTGWVQFFQLGLRAAAVPSGGHQQQRFSVSDRRNVWCLVASPEAAAGVLRLDQDVRLYSSCLDAGRHLVHELAPGRVAWVQLVRGGATVMDERLLAGDGAGLTGEHAVSLTATEETELLLFDLASGLQASGGNGV